MRLHITFTQGHVSATASFGLPFVEVVALGATIAVCDSPSITQAYWSLVLGLWIRSVHGTDRQWLRQRCLYQYGPDMASTSPPINSSRPAKRLSQSGGVLLVSGTNHRPSTSHRPWHPKALKYIPPSTTGLQLQSRSSHYQSDCQDALQSSAWTVCCQIGYCHRSDDSMSLLRDHPYTRDIRAPRKKYRVHIYDQRHPLSHTWRH